MPTDAAIDRHFERLVADLRVAACHVCGLPYRLRLNHCCHILIQVEYLLRYMATPDGDALH